MCRSHSIHIFGPSKAAAVLLIVGILCISHSHALPVGSGLRPRQDTSPLASDQSDECSSIEGDPDMYGLGIRLGVYLQTAATQIAGAYEQKRARDLGNANALFQFAMLFGLSYTTVRNRSLYAVEALVMILFTLCSPGSSMKFISAMSKGPRRLHLRERVLAIIPVLRTMVWTGVIFYQLWFWYVGMYELAHTPCTSSSFFFARVNIYGGFRIFARIWTTYTAVCAAAFILVEIGIWIYKLEEKTEKPEKDKPDENSEKPGASSLQETGEAPEIISDHSGEKVPEITLTPAENKDTTEEDKKAEGSKESSNPEDWAWFRAMAQFYGFRKQSKGIPVLNLTVLGLTVTAAELTIRWNNISGVYSLNTVGQLIPLVIAIGGVVAMIVHWEIPASNPATEENSPNDAVTEGDALE